MYAYNFDEETGGILLTDTEAPMSNLTAVGITKIKMTFHTFGRRRATIFIAGKKLPSSRAVPFMKSPRLSSLRKTACRKAKLFYPST